MGQSNRGPRGIPGAVVAGYFDYHRVPNVDPQGAWASQTFTVSGIFVAPMNGVFINKNRKIDCYLTGIAAGGAGGGGLGAVPTGGNTVPYAQGGQSGNFCIRYKVQLYPGENVTVTIPPAVLGTANANGANGSSLVFGSYLALVGGLGGSATAQNVNLNPYGYNPCVGSSTQANLHTPTGGSIASGSQSSDNVIYIGLSGGPGAFYDNYSSVLWTNQQDGQSNFFYGANYGGRTMITGNSPISSGGGGAGLFGKGGDGTISVSTDGGNADANSGGGGGGAIGTLSSSTNKGGASGGGQLLIEWRIPA